MRQTPDEASPLLHGRSQRDGGAVTWLRWIRCSRLRAASSASRLHRSASARALRSSASLRSSAALAAMRRASASASALSHVNHTLQPLSRISSRLHRGCKAACCAHADCEILLESYASLLACSLALCLHQKPHFLRSSASFLCCSSSSRCASCSRRRAASSRARCRLSSCLCRSEAASLACWQREYLRPQLKAQPVRDC